MYHVVSSREIYRGGVISLRRDDVRYESGDLGIREVIHHPGAVAIAGITEDGRVPLVLQYRHPTANRILEIPAGLLESGQDPLDCAVRELKEEVGGVADKYSPGGWFYTTPGCSDERLILFLAEGVKIGQNEPEDGELLEPVLYPLDEALTLIESGEIVDAKTIIGLYRLKRHIDDQKQLTT